MEQRPYSIYVKHRPTSTGFLIDTGVFAPSSPRFEELVDAVMLHNYKLWGGRINPIIFYSGELLGAENLKTLELADVDCIKTFSPLPKLLRNQLDEKLQPWNIEINDFTNSDVPINVESYSVTAPPTPENLQPFGDSKFLLFEFAPNCEPLLQRFVHRNFGTYFQWNEHNQPNVIRRELWLENLISKINFHRIHISDRKALATALIELAGTIPTPGEKYQQPMRFIAPCELSSPSERFPFSPINSLYQIIIGNAPDDLSEHWNGVFLNLTWTKPYAHQLWLPLELAREPLLHDALKSWLRRYTGAGSSNAKTVEFLSASLSSAELETLRQEICGKAGAWTPRSEVPKPQNLTARKNKAEKDFIPRRALVLSNIDDATRYSATSEQVTLSLEKPEILAEKINTYGVWMVDVQIELVSPHHPTMPDQSWWIVPRLNSGGLLLSMFRGAARVNRHGVFSVRVENQSANHIRRVKPELKINLPNQLSVPRLLIEQPSYHPIFTIDARYNQPTKRPIVTRVSYSDKGEYLHGLVRVFGNFWTARDFCERRFWRSMFAKLAGRDARKDENLRQDIVNLLTKYTQPKGDVDNLAGRILGRVQGRMGGEGLPFSDFQRELDKLAQTPMPKQIVYPQGNTIVSHHDAQHLTEEEMRRGLDDLIALNVLRPGVYVRCSFCGIKTWYHVDELKQQVRCPGCGYEAAIAAQQEWFYALNSLAEMSVSQGQLAVMQALAALSINHLQSFFFSPSLNLFKEGQSKPWHEVDVVTIADGEFVIGEVKDGERDVTKTDFDELAEIAEALRPQRAILFLPAERVAKNTVKMLHEVRNRLSPQGIEAQIFALPTF
jgi:hypothetical protein